MKILFVNHFPLTGSGSGVYTVNLAKSLIARGHECAIVFPENRENYEKFDDIELYPVFFKDNEKIEDQLNFNFPCFSTHPRSDFNFKEMSRRQKMDYQEAFYRKIFEALYYFQPDLIHGQHLWTLSGISSVIAEIANIPLVVTCHGTDIIGINNESEKGLTWGTEWAQEAYDYASAIITISKENTNLLEKVFGQDDKVKLIKNGVDTNVFYKDNSLKRKAVLKEFEIEDNYDNVICFVGKLTEIKGVDTLLEALAINKDKNLLTLIVGDGELRSLLEQQVQDLELENVVFLGNLPQDKLQKIYNIVDCSIVPSRKEAFGLVAAESLICGSPVIATNIGGLSEIVTEDLGMLFEMNDYETLAQDIKMILTKEIEFNRSKLAAKTKSKYSQGNIVEEVENIYKEITTEKEKTK